MSANRTVAGGPASIAILHLKTIPVASQPNTNVKELPVEPATIDCGILPRSVTAPLYGRVVKLVGIASGGISERQVTGSSGQIK